MPSLPQNPLPSTRADGTRGYSVSLLQAAAALYGPDAARLLGERGEHPKTNKKLRE
ncbi:hypothetical protein [Sphingobium sp. EM0848]|uniref:hypothetical protein n=1 Tax=Sphingobium sp. EM0848 TaxID=2743473 RepID=UPI00159C19D8|nr:hypothetical protein [Sphingobium sp. EM0848]